MAEDRLRWRPSIESPVAPPYQTCEVYPAFFTPKQVAAIVALGEQRGLAGAVLEAGDGDEVADGSVRSSQIAWVEPDDESWWIFEKLTRLVQRANRRYGFDLDGFDEDLQYTVYDGPGSFYSWHQDGLDGRVARRKLSVVVQLSERSDYEGGELQFFDLYEDGSRADLDAFGELTGQIGTAVVFPSFEYHRVLPIRSGTRRSLVTWVSGPPFR